jgi:hypothetical protein
MKKLYNLFEEVLVEGGTSILYHFTNPSRLVNILNLNKFYLTPTISTKSEKSKGKMYFMSFSRTKSTRHGYGTQFNREDAVRIKIDGQRLGYNYKIMPIDYWQYPKTPKFMKQGSGDEMEDRVVTNKDEITNANKYIISIDIYVGEKGVDNEILIKAKELGIPINYFNNSKDFANGNPKNSIRPEIKAKDENPYQSYRNFSYTLGALTYKEDEIKNQIFNTLRSEYNISDEMLNKYDKDIEKYHEKLNYYLRDDDYWLTDLTNGLSSELHNNKTSDDILTRYVYREFIKDYKNNDVTSVKEYLVHKYYIGKMRQSDYNKELNNKVNETIKTSYLDNLEKYNYQTYDVDGNSVDGYLSYPPVKAYLTGKMKELSSITSNFILNDNEFFKNYWKISSSELKNTLMGENDDEINNVLSSLTNVDSEDLKSFINQVIWDVDDVVYNEITRIKKETQGR